MVSQVSKLIVFVCMALMLMMVVMDAGTAEEIIAKNEVAWSKAEIGEVEIVAQVEKKTTSIDATDLKSAGDRKEGDIPRQNIEYYAYLNCNCPQTESPQGEERNPCTIIIADYKSYIEVNDPSQTCHNCDICGRPTP